MKKIDLERLREVLDELRDSLIVVEGKKDAAALGMLGLENVVPINGMALHRFVEKIRTLTSQMACSGKSDCSSKGGVGTVMEVQEPHRHKLSEVPVVILTDFDHEGRRLASKLRGLMQRYKLHPNTRLRRELMSFGKNKIEDFGKVAQELGSCGMIEHLRSDKYGEISANIDKICD